jgi:F-type H+-transporting ATPase subunit delta
MTSSVEQDFHATADVGALRIAQVYAEALLATALQRNEADAVLDELNGLADEVFRADPAIEIFLASPAVSVKRKAEVIEATFRGRCSDLLTDFLLVLNQHGRLALLRHVRYTYRELNDRRVHRVRVQVRSAVPLSDEQRGRLEQMTREGMGLEPVLETSIDPDLLGGLVVNVGDWQYDDSVRSRVQRIRDQIIERTSHEIQSGRDRFSSDS